MDDILKKLQKPFHPKYITWKPGVFNRDKTKALGLAYADLRAYMTLLDEVCGMNWSVNYVPWGDRLICNLTIDGVTRSSTGEPDAQSAKSEMAGTVTEAQSFKRAAAMFGLGRYLYNLPSVWAELEDGKKWTSAGKAKLDGVVASHYKRYIEQNPDVAPQPDPGASVETEEMVEEVTEVTSAHVNGNSNGSVKVAAPAEKVVNPLTKELDALGQEIYGDQWPQVRRHNVERITGGKTSDHNVLGEESTNKLISGLKKLKRQRSEGSSPKA
jgi:hypothetical protein